MDYGSGMPIGETLYIHWIYFFLFIYVFRRRHIECQQFSSCADSDAPHVCLFESGTGQCSVGKIEIIILAKISDHGGIYDEIWDHNH